MTGARQADRYNRISNQQCRSFAGFDSPVRRISQIYRIYLKKKDNIEEIFKEFKNINQEMSNEEYKEESLRLLRENNAMLKEMLDILRKTQDPNFQMEENATDFFMNIVANLVANDIERRKKP